MNIHLKKMNYKTEEIDIKNGSSVLSMLKS